MALRRPVGFAPLRWLALALVLAPAACSSAEPVPELASVEALGQTQDALTVCPWGETVPGIDVSYWQGDIDWPAVAASGKAFAIARINDGGFHDPQFAANWTAIRDVGMVRGAYQFYEPTMDPAAQAQIGIDAVGMLGPGDLPVTLDVEWTTGTPNAADIQVWIDLITAGTGKPPMIYTALGYWDQYFDGEFGDIDLWVANWSVNCPHLPSSWSAWSFWQWGGDGTPGIGGNVDQDVFNGTAQDLHDYATADTSQHCSASGAAACGHFGCHCADDACSGGYCPGSGCSAQHEGECAAYGCGCVDGACSGGYCPGTGCTAKEALDCSAQGCGCADHACAGGSCGGSGCTAKQELDCQAQGLGCAQGNCLPADPSGGGAGGVVNGQGGGASNAGASSANGAGGPFDAPQPTDGSAPDSAQHGGCAFAARAFGARASGLGATLVLALGMLTLRGRQRVRMSEPDPRA